MASERTSPPSGPVTSQPSSFVADESASPFSPARAAVAVDAAQEARSATVNSAEEILFRVRFMFIKNTTVFKIFELRGGGFVEPRGYYPHQLRLCKARRARTGRAPG